MLDFKHWLETVEPWTKNRHINPIALYRVYRPRDGRKKPQNPQPQEIIKPDWLTVEDAKRYAENLSARKLHWTKFPGTNNDWTAHDRSSGYDYLAKDFEERIIPPRTNIFGDIPFDFGEPEDPADWWKKG